MAVEWFSHASQGDSNVKFFFFFSFLSLHRSQCNGISMLIYTVKVHNLIQQISTTIAFQRTIMSCKSLTIAKIVGYASCICSMSHTIRVSPLTQLSPPHFWDPFLLRPLAVKNYVERTHGIRYISSAVIPISVIKASNWTRIQKHLSSGLYLFLSQLLIFLFFFFFLFWTWKSLL